MPELRQNIITRDWVIIAMLIGLAFIESLALYTLLIVFFFEK